MRGKEFIERSKNRCLQGQEGAFVSRRTHVQKFWQIIDIMRGGLSFRYIPNREDLKTSSELDILGRDTFFSLEKIPFKSVWDAEIIDESPSSCTLRRHGIEFGELTPSQRSQLEYFIQNHTLGEVRGLSHMTKSSMAWRQKMNEDKRSAKLREIKEYIDILVHSRLLNALPDETLSELHRVLGTAVSLIHHMQAGED